MARSAGLAAAILAGLALGGILTGPVRGHIVYGSPTLSQLVANAAVAARVRILDADGVVAVEDPPLRRPYVEARILEVLKGDLEPGVVRFAQHGHGVASYEKDEEVLLFLQPIEGSRELAVLAQEVDWVSLQEHDAKYLLTPASGSAYLEAARAYAALEGISEPGRQRDSWRRLTLELLASPEARLATAAVTDLALAGEAVALTEEDLALVLPLLEDPSVRIGVRIGLLSVLEDRRALDASLRWVHLLRTTQGPDRVAVVRAARAHPSPPVTAELLHLMSSQDPQIAAAAAMALGVPGNDAAVGPLSKVLTVEDERLRTAALRALGGIATPQAVAVLQVTADSHADVSTRRRARAELESLERLHSPGDK